MKWNAIETATDVPVAAFPFTARPGLRIPLSAEDRPVEFFQLFFGEDTMELLVEETNRSVNRINHGIKVIIPLSVQNQRGLPCWSARAA